MKATFGRSKKTPISGRQNKFAETYLVRDLEGSLVEKEFYSEEEATHYLVEYFPISVTNSTPSKMGWAWKYVMAESYFIRGE